jgi:hypothetical protein
MRAQAHRSRFSVAAPARQVGKSQEWGAEVALRLASAFSSRSNRQRTSTGNGKMIAVALERQSQLLPAYAFP